MASIHFAGFHTFLETSNGEFLEMSVLFLIFKSVLFYQNILLGATLQDVKDSHASSAGTNLEQNTQETLQEM